MRKYIICLVLIIIMLEGVGCLMNSNNKDYEMVVNNYLENKYGEQFEIKQITREVRGDEKSYVRAVCKTGKGDLFNTYVFLNDSDLLAKDLADISDFESTGEISFKDNYYDVVLQNEYADIVQNEVENKALVKCQIIPSGEDIDESAYNKGLKYYISNDKNMCHTRLFVFADSSYKDNKSFINNCKNFVNEYGGYVQYLFICYVDDYDEDICSDYYYKNYDDFEHIIENDSFVNSIEFICTSLEYGIEQDEFIKE